MRDRIMGFKHNQKSMNEDVDRLSSLPDDLIHKIFSTISTKLAVQTSVLSSRWRFIWTSIPYLNLNLSTGDFLPLGKFYNFVERVLSRRNSEIEVSSVKLNFGQKVSQEIVKTVLDYIASHNIQQLTLSVYLIVDSSSSEFPLPRFPSLKYLSLSNELDYGHRLKCTTSNFELPALTTLYLHNVDLCNDGLFSKCANLKNLALKNCGMVKSENFSISHPQLSNLTLDNSFTGMMFVNIDAPKLENLTIRNSWSSKEYVIKIFAPDLTSFVYKGYSCCLSLSTDGFNSLKEADICISKPKFGHDSHIFNLLQDLHNVKFLTLNMEILEHLSSSVELTLRQPFVFTNLTRLRICPRSISSHGQAPNKSYYLDCFPGSTLEKIEEFLEKLPAHQRGL